MFTKTSLTDDARVCFHPPMQSPRPARSTRLSAILCFYGSLAPITLVHGAELPDDPPQSATIALIGRSAIPGKATDQSGLTDTLPDGTPHARLGGFGSGIDYLGKDNLYVAINDRGPWDGATPYRCRFQTFEIVIRPGGNPDPASKGPDRAVAVNLVDTTFLTRDGQPLLGSAAAFDTSDPAGQQRFDPEGIRLSPSNTLWISEEYGPFLDEFSLAGEHLRRITPPSRFMIKNPAQLAKEEIPPYNDAGRQANRGFEGVAITPDGSKLFAVLQSPLIQDNALSETNKRWGVNTRILEIDIASGKTREFLYQLHSPSYGISEILAYSNTGLLILERDGNEGIGADFRRVYRADLKDEFGEATDISGVEKLPLGGLPPGITPLRATELLDFTLGAFGLNGETMPEKIEGMCFGPVLPDGRLSFIVVTDNDLQGKQPSWFWVFAIDPSALPGYTPRAWPRNK